MSRVAMSKPVLLLAACCLLLTWPARAATVQRINKEKTRIIVSLSQAEMATLENGQEVGLEVLAKPERFVSSGILSNLNPLKKTIVVTFPVADPRLVRKQVVRFLSIFWNPVLSPQITSYSQYHQYSRSSFHGGLGGFYEGQTQKRDDRDEKLTASGTQFVVDGYLLFNTRWTGFGFGYERRDVTVSSETTVKGPVEDVKDKTDYEIVVNRIKPGIWLEVQTGWRLGLRYDYTLYEVTQKGEPSLVFYYEFGEPVLGLTRYGGDLELGVDFKAADKFTAVDTRTINGVTSESENTIKRPAQVFTYFRSVSSPLFVWGGGFGYIFYERELQKDQELRPKATPAELLIGRLAFEHRLEDGDKLDWMLFYAGGKSLGLSGLERVANTGGVNLTYQMTLGESLLAGTVVNVEGGILTLKDEVQDDQGESEQVDRKVTGYGASVLLFAQFEFDPLARGRRP